MTIETNKVIARRFFDEIYNQRNLAVIDELLAPQVVNHNSGVSGRESARKLIGAVIARFPDVHVTFEDLIAEGDKVVIRGTDHFTDPLTRKMLDLTWIEIVCFQGGRIAEAWYEADMSSYAGLIPDKGAG